MGVSVATQQTAQRQRANPKRSASHPGSRVTSSAAQPILRLQRAVGNRAISRVLQSRTIQPKLTVRHPDDEYEREADRVADQVMRMPQPTVSVAAQSASLKSQSVCAECDNNLQPKPSMTLPRAPIQISRMCPECEMADHRDGGLHLQTKIDEKKEAEEEDAEPAIYAKLAAGDPPDVPDSLESALSSNHHDGSPLPEPLRDFFEPRFGADLGAVRLHQNARSAEMAEQLNASAFTVGQDVFFGAGQYAPATDHGQRLIAHEVMHTLQQSGVQQAKPSSASSAVVNEEPPTERAAERGVPGTEAGAPTTQPGAPTTEPGGRETEPAGRETQPGGREIEPGVPGTQPILPDRVLILSPTAVSMVTPILRTPLAPIIQRRANVSLAPPGLACILVDVHGIPGELDVMFDKDQAALSAINLGLIENYVGLWVSRGLSPDLTISGYASTDGSQRHNWQLSCQRAEAVQSELLRIGVPPGKTTIFAHGETNDFDATSLEPNRRATIDSTPGTPPVITPSLIPADNFAGRSLARFGLSETIFVDYSATPSITAAEHFGVQWMVLTGTGTIINLPLVPDIYTAGNTPATEQLALIVSAGPAVGTRLIVVNVPVIAPLTSYMVQVPGSGLCHTTGTASVGFRGRPFMLPADVSFTGIQWREGTGTGIGTDTLSGLNGRVHPIGGWMSIGTGNVATGCPVNTVDSVWTSTSSPSSFLGFFVDWSGLFVWPIQWEYQAPGAAVSPLVVANHLCVINRTGTANISKAGAGPFSRVLADPTSCVAPAGLAAPLCC